MISSLCIIVISCIFCIHLSAEILTYALRLTVHPQVCLPAPLSQMDEQAQRMKTNALLRLMWYDDYLAWNENFFANISSILLKQSSVWLPDIVVSNTVIGQTDLGYDNLQVE